MDARHLETFHAVVRCGSLRAAALDLKCAQSTITVRIQELEHELGAPLFTRHGRKSVLTEAGHAVFERSARIAESITALKDVAGRFVEGAAGRVRFGAIEPTASHRLPAIITAFYRERPNLQLIVETGGAEHLQRLVAEGELDFIISSPPTLDSSLSFEHLFDERIGLLIPRKHALATRKRIAAADLEKYPIVLTDRWCAYRRSIEAALGGVTMSRTIVVGNTVVLRGLVTAGIGVGLIPAKGASGDHVVLRQIHGVSLSLPVGIVTRPDHALTPVQQALRDRLRSELRP